MSAERGPDPAEPVVQIPASDWTDMDLLTRELADDLLVREIAAETEILSHTRNDASLSEAEREASAALRTRRIDAMRQRRDDLATDSAPLIDRHE
jgi:hypothetical protein